ncbi:MAG: hypothetical protein R3257_08050, partial [bacterium]|nr:hypothetical protein [bacterium]
MKKLKLFGLTLISLALLFGPVDCATTDNNGGGGTGPAPTQAQINEIGDLFREFGEAVFPPGTACYTSCEEFAGDSEAFEGPADCPGGGSGNISVTDCDASGKITFSASLENCVDDEGNVGTGTLTIMVTITPTQITIMVMADGFEIEGFSFTGSVTTT